MSHSNELRSGHQSSSASWMSLPETDETGRLGQGGLRAQQDTMRSASPVSAIEHQDLEDDDTKRSVNEGEALLAAGRSSSRRLSVLSITDQSFTDATSKSAPLHSIEQRKCRACNVSDSSHEHLLRVIVDMIDTGHMPPARWLPYTLRHPFLISLTIASTILMVILAVLTWKSHQSHGLGKDDGSTGLLVGWRYTPTIVAVLFTQAVVMTAEDTKRTEAFARMTTPEPIQAKFTLFHIPRVWWNSTAEGFSRKRSGGHKRWVLAFSSLTAGISILILSTLSSSLFVAKEILLHNSVQLQRYTLSQDAARSSDHFQLRPRRDTYFHTISGFLYNATTSMWVADAYVVLPFLPTDSATERASLENGIWEAETTVIQTESSCVPMTMMEKTNFSVSYNYAAGEQTCCQDGCTQKTKGFKMRSDDGCEVQIQSPVYMGCGLSLTGEGYLRHSTMDSGGVTWTNMSSTYISWQHLVEEHGQNLSLSTSGEQTMAQWAKPFIYSMTDHCLGRDLILANPPWVGGIHDADIPWAIWDERVWANFTARAEVCSTTYYAADLPAIATIGESNKTVSFDASEHKRLRQQIPKDVLDADLMNEITFGAGWDKYMPASNADVTTSGFLGVSMLLAQSFGQNLTEIILNPHLAQKAGELRTRFASELILSSVVDADTPMLQDASGQMTIVGRRILVIPEIGIPLAILFFLAACYSSVLLWCASSHQRPLGLRADPATALGSSMLLHSASLLATTLRGLSSHDRRDMKEIMGSQVYDLQSGVVTRRTTVNEVSSDGSSEPVGKKRRPWFKRTAGRTPSLNDWRPAMLKKTWLAVFLVTLIAVAITLLVLRKYALEFRLYRSAFVYQVNIGLFNVKFSPHSLIATLVAVGLALCWDGIDRPMRTLQPYLSMSSGYSNASRTLSLSYQSSYWIWAAAKAASNRHWILCLVAIGATMSQICKSPTHHKLLRELIFQVIVSMAAIFERQIIVDSQSTFNASGSHMYSLLAIRQEPYDVTLSLNWRPYVLSDSLLGTSQSDWLYNALDEITLGTPAIAWTKDEWSFTPVNMQALPNVTTPMKSESNSRDYSSLEAFSSPANVTLVTSGLRSRLECSAIDVPAEGWLDQASDVFSNRTSEDLDGFVLPLVLFANESYHTPVYSAPRRIACCVNGTGQGQQSVIAYWSSNSSMIEQRPLESLDENAPEDLIVPGAWDQNFTIKWIMGPGASAEIDGGDLMPDMQFMGVGTANETLLYFTKVPEMSFLNCVPVIESANASLVVARSSGEVLEFELLHDPVPAPGAFEYAYDLVYPDPLSNHSEGNVRYVFPRVLAARNLEHPGYFLVESNMPA